MNGDMTAFKRHYTPYVRRCDELEKKLSFFLSEMARYGITPEAYTAAEFEAWAGNQRDTLAREHRGLSLLDYWESIIDERHRDYVAIKTERDRTAATLYHTVQRRLVIDKAKVFFLEAAMGGAGAEATSPPAGTSGSERACEWANDEVIDAQPPPTRFPFPHSSRAAAGARRAAVAADDVEASSGSAAPSSAADADALGLRFQHIAGIVLTEDKARFARIVFRASAGHAVVRFADIAEPLVDDRGVRQAKTVFTLFFRGRTLGGKLDRICSAFNAHQHDIPQFSDPASVRDAAEETRRVMDDSIVWLRNEQEASATSLRHLALLVAKWRTGVQREKAVYHTLNMFLRQPERGTVSGQAWVLRDGVAAAQAAIRDVHAAAASGGRLQPFYLEVLPPRAAGGAAGPPPTHFATNKVTRVFQGIVNTYGVPRYGEANPALYSIATFPFLFGVMYGDVGHASFLTLAALYIVLREEHFGRQKLDEMFAMCFKGRYMLLFMGLCGIYCGLMYNDVFSIAMSSYGGTRWMYPEVTRTATVVNASGAFVVAYPSLATVAVKTSGTWSSVYPFGVDPVWHSADDDLLFFNSLKMKMSVIFGITQMTFGLVLKVCNALYFKSRADLYLEAIPQLVFMVSLFGYMIFLIMLKWCINWNDAATAPGAPPSLIDTLINVALKPGVVTDQMYAGQPTVQLVILAIVFLTVPIMLFGKPLAAHFAGKAKAKAKALRDAAPEAAPAPASPPGVAAAVETANPAFAAAHAPAHGDDKAALAAPAAAHGHDDDDDGGHGGGHGESFSDVFVHQAIETIEFVLGSISNTASYLRLWALSLAHSQLATVFWERALVSQIETGNFILIFVGWAVFAAITIAVLLLMDVLECFLHALRLHWVEFRECEGGRANSSAVPCRTLPISITRTPSLATAENKFFKADGVKFMPFSFAALAQAAEEESD